MMSLMSDVVLGVRHPHWVKGVGALSWEQFGWWDAGVQRSPGATAGVFAICF
jgi:hypothetical protein